MDPTTIAAELIVAFFCLLTYREVVKNFFQKIEEIIGMPTSLDFYPLFFLAFVAAGIGGVMWMFCQKVFPSLYAIPPNVIIDPSVGGSREPHGLAAFLWPIVTFLPSTVLFCWVSKKYELLPCEKVILVVELSKKYKLVLCKKAVLVALVMLGSLAIASLLFYDFPLFGFQGFRSYFLIHVLDYQTREMWLVFIWSAILSAFPFLVIYFLNLKGLISEPGASLTTCAYAIITTFGLTTFSVALFITFFTSPESELLRGAIAGMVLRILLFFGLLINSNGPLAEKIAKDIKKSVTFFLR